jgi:hypothetical protein
MAKLKKKMLLLSEPIQSQPCDLLLHPTLLRIEFRAYVHRRNTYYLFANCEGG